MRTNTRLAAVAVVVAAMVVAAMALMPAPARAQVKDTTLAHTIAEKFAGDTARRSRLSQLMRPGDYGIPTSPAFALLPEQPSEVTHLVTPHDFQSNVKSWYEGGKVKAGIAVDTRPFARAGGSLGQYQVSAFRRIAFGTILSAGTATATKGSDDVLGAVGLRIPLVNRGDPRMDTAYLDSLGNAYDRVLDSQPPIPVVILKDSVKLDSARTARMALVATKVGDSLRARFARRNWNAFRIDLGLAGIARAASGAASKDSLTSGAGGVWLATRIRLGSRAQLSLAAKGLWTRADSATQETRRRVAGGRLLAFLGEQLSLSLESSQIWSDHRKAPDKDDRWQHFGAVLEWYVPELQGWIGAGYGGDRQRSAGNKNQFSLQYAFYTDRLIAR